ncbi:MAG: hypothetical protein HY270_10270, partial [Deltaproteobacteria bacterium]|nr:hypothetical protein [Deltaproteobacteria bacterium]
VIRDNDHLDGHHDYTYADILDADGDGLVDLVDFSSVSGKVSIARHGSGAWCAATNATDTACATTDGQANVIARPDYLSWPGSISRPDMLVQMDSGLGADTYLTYRPSTQWDNTDAIGNPRLPFVVWTLSQIKQDDGLCGGSGANAYVCDAASGSHEVRSDLTYAYGLYDYTAREFRGFRRVDQFAGDGNSTTNATQTTTFFLQDAARKGKVNTTYLYPSYPKNTAQPSAITYSYNAWYCADITNSQTHPSTAPYVACPIDLAPGQRLWPRLVQSVKYDNAIPTQPQGETASNLAWDDYGNVTQTSKGGSATTSVMTYTLYVPPGPNSHITDKPQQIWVEDGSTNAVLEEKWFAYDGNAVGASPSRGNARTVYSWLDQSTSGLPTGSVCPTGGHGTGGSCVTTTMTYDNDGTSTGYGNIRTVTDANLRVATTDYDTATHIYPYLVHNPASQCLAKQYDPSCGKMTSQTIAYPCSQSAGSQPSTTSSYDNFCRLSATALPDESLSDPHTQVNYYLGYPGRPTTTTMMTVEPWMSLANGHVKHDELFDALGRHLQTQVDAVVAGSVTRIASATSRFDVRGNVDVSYSPFTSSFAGIFAKPPTGTGTTSYQYDAANRVTKVINPDGGFRTMDYSVPFQTTTKDECYNATGADACPGGKIIEKRDAFGRVVEKQLYKVDTFETATKSTFDALGRPIETKQGTALNTWSNATKITITYDSLGRKLTLTDPDSGSSTPGTWTYGYDLVGNLLYQNDPKTGQAIQFVYDALNRVTRKVYLSQDNYCNLATCTAVTKDTRYDFDQMPAGYSCDSGICPSGNCSIGRLTHVLETDDITGGPGTENWFCHDVRGRQQYVETEWIVGTASMHTTVTSTFDRADHLLTVKYPDTELVTYTYDEAGQVYSVDGQDANHNGLAYMDSQTYDIFGRPLALDHSNGINDAYTYWGPEKNFHLRHISAGGTSADLFEDEYDQYQKNGLLKHVTDQLSGTSSPMGDTAPYTYDGLGRLTSDAYFNQSPKTYTFNDHLDNLTNGPAGATLTYGNAVHPHQVTAHVSAGAVVHDANGNRTAVGTSRTYAYTTDDRLYKVFDSGAERVEFIYDYSGRRMAKRVDPNLMIEQDTWYLGDLMEVSERFATKYYFAGGRRIASQRYWRPMQFLAQRTKFVEVAGLPGGGFGLMFTLHQTASWAVGVVGVIFGLTVLLVPPGKRKAVVGVTVRRGPVIGLITVVTLGSLPLPIVVRPAWGGGAPPTPTPTPMGANSLGVMHYHYDELGSVIAITTASGGQFRSMSYDSWALRHSAMRAGSVVNGCNGTASDNDEYCHGFTGYDYEPVSGLYYAGARWYEPQFGTFLTHDPVPGPANPYSYVGWDPTNATDPSGACVDLCISEILIAVAIGAAAGFAASAIQAGVNGASLGEALKAGLIGGAIGGASAGVGAGILQPALGAVIGSTVGTVGGYTAGEVATATLFTTGLGLAAYGAAQNDYTGIIGLGISIGVAITMSNGAQPAPAQGANGQLNQSSTASGQDLSGQSDAYGPRGDLLKDPQTQGILRKAWRLRRPRSERHAESFPLQQHLGQWNDAHPTPGW